MINKMIVHGSLGYTVLARYNEKNEVVVEKLNPFFEEGSKDSTVGNCMVGLIKTLKDIDISQGQVYEIATISGVADKINSNILLKEYYKRGLLSNTNPRALTEDEIKVYKSLIVNIKKTYGNILYRSEEFVPKSDKPNHTEDQKQWVNLYIEAKRMVDSYSKPAPTTVGKFDEEEPDLAI